MTKIVVFILPTLVALLALPQVSGQQRRRTSLSRGRPAQFQEAGRSQFLLARYVPNKVLIQLRRDAGNAKVDIRERIDALRFETVSAVNKKRGELLLVDIPDGEPVENAIARLKGVPGIAFAQPDWIYSIQEAEPDDPAYRDGNLWGMYTKLPGCQAEKAWAVGNRGSREIYVGVLDEGVQIDHPDLASNIWTNPGETGWDSQGRDKATNSEDDDGDGFCDDVHGWDFVNNDGSVYDGGPGAGLDKHGTHIAGTIGAIGDNGIGVVGVCWYVTMIPAKALELGHGTTDAAIKAIDYFVMLKSDKRLNLKIVAINASWGIYKFDLGLLEAIKRAAHVDILFIAAAGNDHANTDLKETAFYPACYSTTTDTSDVGGTPGEAYDSVISVTAIKRNGQLSSFSNYGLTTVDLGAPGVSILSTWPFNTYEAEKGTSMATPHVTGAVALYASTHRSATAQTIKKAILDAATPTDSLAHKTTTGGRLNVSTF